MKTVTSRILAAVFVLVFCAGTGVLVHYCGEARHEIACRELLVSLPGPHHFVSEEEVRSWIDNFYGIYVGQRVGEVNLGSIENMLRAKQSVRTAEVWITDDGILHAEVVQRDPVLRFDKDGNGCYVDRGGNMFPLAADYEADVPVISCNPALGADTQWLFKAIALVRKFSSSPVWSSRITGYSVAPNGDFILEGEDLRIIYGDFLDAARKEAAMEKYFTAIVPASQGQPYHTVNIKYKGQIICRTDS